MIRQSSGTPPQTLERPVVAGKNVPPVRGAEAMNHGFAELNEGYAAALGVAPTQLG